MENLYFNVVDNLVDIFKQPIMDMHNRFILDLIHKNNKLIPEPKTGFYYDGYLYKEPDSRLKMFEAPELDESLVPEFNSIMQAHEESLDCVGNLKKELFANEYQFNSFCQSCFTKTVSEYKHDQISYAIKYNQILWAIKNFLPQELTSFDPTKYPSKVKFHTRNVINAPLEDFGKKKLELSETASNTLNYLLGLQLL